MGAVDGLAHPESSLVLLAATALLTQEVTEKVEILVIRDIKSDHVSDPL